MPFLQVLWNSTGVVSHVIMNKSICIMHYCNYSGLSSSTCVSAFTCHHSLYLLVFHLLPLVIHHLSLSTHHLLQGIHHLPLGICWVPPCLLEIHNLPPGIVVSADALPFHHQWLPWECCLPVLNAVCHLVLPNLQTLKIPHGAAFDLVFIVLTAPCNN